MTPEGAAVRRTPHTFGAAFAGLLLLATLLRAVFPTADPPWRTTVGIVWHDEGAWVHNARNKALFGEWTLDAWNPLYVAPVFTGLEYLSFRTLGVGLWQARVVSMVGGIVSVLLLGLAIGRAGGRGAGLAAAALLATNYVFVMWNRAALLETTMVAFIVAGFFAYVRALDQPRWGLVAGLCAWLAFFSKAAAAFFLPAVAIAALAPIVTTWLWPPAEPTLPTHERRAGLWVMAGLGLGAALGLVLFVGPNWQEFWFYNWQMSVTRKPSYSIGALTDRLSWFPIVHDTFTRMWCVLVVALTTCLGALMRWRSLPGADRLLLCWIAVGAAELVIHDVGNERRLVMLIPALCGLAALALLRDGRLVPERVSDIRRGDILLIVPLLLYVLYVGLGPLARLPFLYEVRPAVRLSAALAVVAGCLVVARWTAVRRALAGAAIGTTGAWLVVGLVVVGDLLQFGQWSWGRTYRNYEAARLLAERLPPGTLVHGKLANGLSLESRIKPVFVGREFGNYDDRLRRDDIQYVLTYISPEVGYEGPVITDVLAASSGNRVLWTVPVAETTCGCDAAALIEKRVTTENHAKPALSVEVGED